VVAGQVIDMIGIKHAGLENHALAWSLLALASCGAEGAVAGVLARLVTRRLGRSLGRKGTNVILYSSI
jgi:hypothetical protein